MDPRDLAVRNATYALFVERGAAPTPGQVAEAVAGHAVEEVEEAWRRLHDAHALVLVDRDGPAELLMANPFTAQPTNFRVQADGRGWDANCAWDAFGVCAALGVDGRIETSCPDCGDDLTVEVRDQRPVDDDLLFHCLVPASRWWDNIAFP